MSWALKEKYRAILSREKGYYEKAWGEHITVCLAYPNAYRTGMSNLGFQTVYDLFNRSDACLCERVFLPDPEEEAEFRRGEISLFSLESQRPLADFDILAFSLSFENDYPNILKILELGRIPFLARERSAKAPLLLGGGMAATLNPEPLADFFDCFILGEGEEVIAEFLRHFREIRQAGAAPEEILFHLQKKLTGFYAPRFYQVTYGADGLIEKRAARDKELPETIKKRRLPDINAFPTEQCICAKDTELGEMLLVEVSRGCSRGCRFCAAGFVCRPARFRGRDLLEASFGKALERSPKIGLLGTAVSDHPELVSLCRAIREQGGKVAIGSLRLDRIDRELIAMLKEGGTETLALAPEAGSQRLRDVIHKGIGEEQIVRAVEVLTEEKIPNLRLYFMVGLPTEEEEDIEAIIQLTRKIKHIATSHSQGAWSFKRITLSINQFIPKAATPFQWCPLTDILVVKKRVRRIEQAFRREPFLRVIHDMPKWNYVQALLSLGDRRGGEILLAVHRHGGNWPQACKEVNLNPDFYVYRPKDLSEILPWDFIDHGVSKSFLKEEYGKAFPELKITPSY